MRMMKAGMTTDDQAGQWRRNLLIRVFCFSSFPTPPPPSCPLPPPIRKPTLHPLPCAPLPLPHCSPSFPRRHRLRLCADDAKTEMLRGTVHLPLVWFSVDTELCDVPVPAELYTMPPRHPTVMHPRPVCVPTAPSCIPTRIPIPPYHLVQVAPATRIHGTHTASPIPTAKTSAQRISSSNPSLPPRPHLPPDPPPDSSRYATGSPPPRASC
ncbi:hypothetical protein C8J57DRAFT_1513203 [Mycena rebaudengoi]|nr:hypothetical protein C8J57DRAFT_1513203 [Mycena rebaudengoi]